MATQQTFLDCPASSFYCSANEVFTVTRLHCPHIHCSSSPQIHGALVIVSARISVSGFEDKSRLGTPPGHNLAYQLFPSAFAKKIPNFSSAPTFNVHFIDFFSKLFHLGNEFRFQYYLPRRYMIFKTCLLVFVCNQYATNQEIRIVGHIEPSFVQSKCLPEGSYCLSCSAAN